MFKKLGEFLFFILAFFTGVAEIKSGDRDYSFYTEEERCAFVLDNLETYEKIVEFAYENTDEALSNTSIFTYDPAKKDRLDTREIQKVSEERVSVHRTTKDGNPVSWVAFGFRTGVTGFSSCGVYYTEDNLCIDPASGTEAVYNEEEDIYSVYLASSYGEVSKITTNWYFYKKAFPSSGDSGYKAKPVEPATSEAGDYPDFDVEPIPAKESETIADYIMGAVEDFDQSLGFGVLPGNYAPVARYIDNNGNTLFEKYQFNEVETYVDPNKISTCLGILYDEMNNPIIFFLAADYENNYRITYDNKGRISTITDTLGSTFSYSYNEDGTIFSAGSESYNTYFYDYNAELSISNNDKGNNLILSFDSKNLFVRSAHTGSYTANMTTHRDINGHFVEDLEVSESLMYQRFASEPNCTYFWLDEDLDNDKKPDTITLSCEHTLYKARALGEMCGTDEVTATLTINDASTIFDSDGFAGNISVVDLDGKKILAVDTDNQGGIYGANLFLYEKGSIVSAGSILGKITNISYDGNIISRGYECGRYTGETIVYSLEGGTTAVEAYRYPEVWNE